MPPAGPWIPLLVAIAARVLVAASTAVPARDAATYLWLSERVAAGDFRSLFDTVFHPLYPVLVALPRAILPGVPTVTLGQWVSCGLAALAVLPLHALSRRLLGLRAAFWATMLYAVGAWFCRHPADCLSEGPFYLAVTLAALWLVSEPCRPALAGIAAAAAYLLRPEGASLLLVGLPWLWLRGRRRQALAFALAFAAVGGLLPIGHALWGAGFTLSPKVGFVWQVGAGAGDGLAHYLRELLRLPGAALDDLGFLTLPLALFAAVRWRPRSPADPGVVLLAPLLLQVLVIPVLHGHYRFVSGYGVLLLPYAGLAVAGLLSRLGASAGWGAAALAAAVVLAPELARLPHPRRQDRVVERELGHWLRARLPAGAGLATDMPRLSFYAGRRPPPPRPLTREDLLGAAARPEVRCVAFVRRRTPIRPGELAALGLEPVDLPPILAALAGRRGVLVYEKSK